MNTTDALTATTRPDVLFTAPHHPKHQRKRDGELHVKANEVGTGALARYANTHLGTHALINQTTLGDPNWGTPHPFKTEAINLASSPSVHWCLDLHGMKQESAAQMGPHGVLLAFGTSQMSPDPTENPLLAAAVAAAQTVELPYDINPEGYAALGKGTMTHALQKARRAALPDAGAAALQIEICRTLRPPEGVDDRTADFLTELVSSLDRR